MEFFLYQIRFKWANLLTTLPEINKQMMGPNLGTRLRLLPNHLAARKRFWIPMGPF